MGKILELVGCRDILITTESTSIPDSVLREIKIEQSMCKHSHGAIASLPLSVGSRSIAQRNNLPVTTATSSLSVLGYAVLYGHILFISILGFYYL